MTKTTTATINTVLRTRLTTWMEFSMETSRTSVHSVDGMVAENAVAASPFSLRKTVPVLLSLISCPESVQASFPEW